MPVEVSRRARQSPRLWHVLGSLAMIAALVVLALPTTQVEAAAQTDDQPATITIINQVDGLDPAIEPTLFVFLQSPRLNDLGADFVLTSGESNTFQTPAGTTRIARGVQRDWTVSQVDCGTTPVTVDNTQATITPAPGDQVICTFTNTWTPPARVTFSKEVTAGADDTEFLIELNDTRSTLMAGETRTIRAEVGTFQIAEYVTAGLKLPNTSCAGVATTTSVRSIRQITSVPVALGDDIICTSTSEPAGPSSLALSMSTVDAPAGDTTAFTFEGPSGVEEADPGRFTVSASAPVSFVIDAGIHNFNQLLTETPGWAMSDFVCTPVDHSWSDDDEMIVRPRLTVAVLPETDISCTITNTLVETADSQPATTTTIATQLSAPTISAAPSGPTRGPFDPIAPVAASATADTGIGGGSEALGTTLAATGAQTHTTIATTLILVGACFLATARVSRRRSE